MHERARTLNEQPIKPGPILYWMDRDMRIEDNWALIVAQDLARERNVSLLVVYNLVCNFEGGTLRQWAFKIGGLKEVAASCADIGLPFTVLLDETGHDTPQRIRELVQRHAIGAMVTDFSPLRIQRQWKQNIANNADCAVFEVDAHNIVPAWIASPKQEVGARTLRPKLYKLLPRFLTAFPEIPAAIAPSDITLPAPDWDALSANTIVDHAVQPVSWAVPGAAAARTQLQTFINTVLPRYATDRNDPHANAQSNLSPYLHYGMLSAQRVALAVLEAAKLSPERAFHHSANAASTTSSGMHASAQAYLEELIVRRELSDNFCLYNSGYDSIGCFPAWAQRSHDAHKDDPREHLYSYTEFDEARTHDPLWNAAQREMTQHGKMHGYMRMYWAKKILEWTRSPEEAMQIAIRLNDRYELDGRDPNGYAGIAWSIGGVHDRPWFNRPIFGSVRYMARSGCDKKFDTSAYIARHTQ